MHGTLEELHCLAREPGEISCACSRKMVAGSCRLLALVPTECGEFGCRLR
jgi:hypothetical protein